MNIRKKGKPFRPEDFFKRDFLGGNAANVMILDGYDANYVLTNLKWVDDNHLKILIAGYDQLAKNTIDDYMNHYGIIFDKKLNHWGSVEIEYEDMNGH